MELYHNPFLAFSDFAKPINPVQIQLPFTLISNNYPASDIELNSAL